MAPIVAMRDGKIALRPPRPGDAQVLIAGRDEVFHRWLGPGSDDPKPAACITAGDQIVGWVDYDSEREWLRPGEVNIGYNVFAPYRRNGYATRAVQLLTHHLAPRTDTETATLVIDADNGPSIALATHLEFKLTAISERQHHFARPVPPLIYGDGVVTIRSPQLEDLDADLEVKDDLQIDWMWLPGERETWSAMSPGQQRDHARCGLQQSRDAFGTGPKWTFSVEAPKPPTSPTSIATSGVPTSQPGRPTSPIPLIPATETRATSVAPSG
jgi:RimJ/RimL family protein N-acetyltransferase